MAHRRSDSRFSLRSPLASPMSNTFTFPVMSSTLLGIGYPRKSRVYSTTFLALFALITVSTYIFFVARPALAHAPISLHADSTNDAGSGRRIIDDIPHSRLFQFPPSYYRKLPPIASPAKTRLQLDPSQELAAVSSFLASLPQNVIPSTVDPSRPIDPQLVLDFDTRSSKVTAELKQMVDDVWAQNPVILYSQGSHYSREVEAMIVHMNLSPPPTIFQVDQRADRNILEPLLLRITSSAELPILLVGGKPVGTTSKIAAFFRSHELHKMVTDAGAIVDGAPGRGKRRK